MMLSIERVETRLQRASVMVMSDKIQRVLHMRSITHAVMSNGVAPAAYDNTIADIYYDDEIAKRSKDSAAMLPYWNLVDDLVKGKDAVIASGKKYLPQFDNELTPDYNTRLALAQFTNVYRDIVENLACKPFEKSVTLPEGDDNAAVPPQIKNFIEDVDGSGNDITEFASQNFFNAINYSVDWIFIDYPDIEIDGVRTVEQERQLGIRPFWTHVLGLNVLEAKSMMINGKEEWSLIRIFEPDEDTNRVRKMWRNEVGAFFEIWKEVLDPKVNKKRFMLEKSGPITIGMIPMVMCYTGRRDGKRYYFYPPMRDAADMQVELYQQESGNKFIRTIAAYPMLAGNGVKPELGADKKPLPIGIGPMRTLYAPPDGNGKFGQWSFLSPDASLMTYLDTSSEKTTNKLRELGRQPLTAQSGNLTVITTAVAAGKAKSAVGAWAVSEKNALEQALYITGLWYSIKGYDKPVVDVYLDFDDFSDTAEDKTALRAMRDKGDLSQRTYWNEMKRRGTLSDDFDAEKEEKALLEELPGDEELDADGNPIVYDARGLPVKQAVKPPVKTPAATT